MWLLLFSFFRLPLLHGIALLLLTILQRFDLGLMLLLNLLALLGLGGVSLFLLVLRLELRALGVVTRL